MRWLFSALAMVLFVPMSAQAQLDHPDLLDVSTWFASPAPKDGAWNGAWVVQNESGNSAGGSITSNGYSGYAEVSWHLYEPDTVKRSFKRGRLDQKAWVMIGVSTWNSVPGGASTGNTTTLENCKASTITNGTGGAATDAKWKASCKGALAAMSLSQDALDRLELVFSKSVNVTKDKINISGKGPLAPSS